MRQTQGSMICPSCGKLISVTEEKCPFCGAWNPSLYGYGPGLQKWIGRRLDLVSVIVTACVGLYIISLALQPQAILQFTGLFGILAPGMNALYQLGMTSPSVLQAGMWWTLLTAIYLHGSLLHIFFNVMWIRQLGPAVIEFFGPARTFVIFSVAGAVGFLVSDLVGGGPSIGASGAIFGLLAALIVYGRRANHSMLTRQVWQWAIIVFAMGFLMSGVNNWAHAGGFAGGWVTATMMPIEAQRREGRLVMIVGLLLALATAGGVLLSFWQVTGLLFHSRG